MNVNVEFEPSGEIKRSPGGEERTPLFEIKAYQPPKSFHFAFSTCLSRSSFLIIYPILTLIFLVIALITKVSGFPDSIFITACFLTGFCLLASLLMCLVFPLVMKRNLSKLPKTDLRFYEGMMEMVNRVEAEGKDVGGIKTPIAYSSIIKLKQTSSCLFLLFLYNGKWGTLGIEKSSMPEGLLEFLLKQKK